MVHTRCKRNKNNNKEFKKYILYHIAIVGPHMVCFAYYVHICMVECFALGKEDIHLNGIIVGMYVFHRSIDAYKVVYMTTLQRCTDEEQGQICHKNIWLKQFLDKMDKDLKMILEIYLFYFRKKRNKKKMNSLPGWHKSKHSCPQMG